MQSRPAELRDIPALVEMGRKFHAVSGYDDVPYDENTMVDLFIAMVRGGGMFVVGDKPVGMIGGLVFPVFFNRDKLMAQELFWWSESPGAGKALLDAFEGWAKDMGAERVVMMALDALEGAKVGEILKRRGYKPAESNYMKVI
jgi:hypothetical protein